jgi:replicative DNA helicase
MMPFEKTIDDALPHNLDAEQALIGCLLFDGSAYIGLEDMISADHFFLAAHGKIFGHAMQLAKRGEPIDAIVIGHLMEGDAAYREVGGLRYMQDMVTRAAPVAALANYAQIIVDAAVRRETVRLAEYMIDEAMKNRDDTAQDILSASQKNLEEVAVFGPAKASWVDLGSIYLRQLHRSRHLDGDAPGIATGIHDLDKVLGGLRPSTTNVLGARPGMGKSAVAVQIALNVAQAGYGVAFFSLEMPEEQLATRFGCALAYDRMAPVYSGKSDNPTYEDFERGELTEAQWEKLERAAGLLADLPIYMDFRSKLKVSHMAGAVRRLKREWLRRGIKPGLII